MAAVKVPLEMKDGVKVRNITELRENFDIEKVVGYFLDGRLKKWLDARYYEDEAEAVNLLDENDPLLSKKICEIFDVECNEEVINTEEIAKRNERVSRLKQYADDGEIIKNIDAVAFNQEELAKLYDMDFQRIYLCEGEFKIPESKRGLEYEIIGEVQVEGLDSSKNHDDVCKTELKEQEIITHEYKFSKELRDFIRDGVQRVNKINNVGKREYDIPIDPIEL